MLTRRTFVKALAAVFPAAAALSHGRAADQAPRPEREIDTASGPKVGHEGTCTTWKANQPRLCNWIGSSNPNVWNDPKNWLDGIVPHDGDDVHIMAHTPAPTMPDGLVVRNLYLHRDAKIGVGRCVITSTIYSG